MMTVMMLVGWGTWLTHDCLSWNMNVVTPALLGMRFQTSAAERAAAMAEHRPNMPNVG